MQKILIASEKERVQFRLGSILSREGYNVLTAGDCPKALRMLEDVDLIFADFPLAQSSGTELLNEIKSRGLTSPLIMIINKKDRERVEEAISLGALDCMFDSVSKDMLLKVARIALTQKHLLDEKLKAEKEREVDRQYMVKLLNSLHDAVITVDNNMYIIEVNQAAKQVCELHPEEIIGRHFDSIQNDCLMSCRKVVREALRKQRDIRDFRIECRHGKRPNQIVLVNSLVISTDVEQKNSGGILVLRDISRVSQLEEQLRERQKYQSIVYKSKIMRRICGQIEDLSGKDTTVLIRGERGTGKELLGQTLHYSGPRAFKPLIFFDCSVQPENIMESELFGCVRGSFQGSVREQKGKLELAEGGTLVLVDIDRIYPMIQVKLCRLLRDREYERVGQSMPIRPDVRVIATTTANLGQMCAKGEFRPDLYAQLRSAEIEIPPLRERIDDVPLLINYFCGRFNQRFGKDIEGVDQEVLRTFMDYHWPGNVMELEDTIEHAFLLCQTNTISLECLPIRDLRQIKAGEILQRRRKEASAEEIRAALQISGARRARTAQLLGMSRQNLYRLMRKYQIDG